MKEFIRNERSKLAIKIYGKEFSINKPTVGQAEKIQSDLEAAKDDSKKTYSIIKSFLMSLGLPLEVIINLEIDHFTELVEFVIGVKKN